jgi:hypothetical protein
MTTLDSAERARRAEYVREARAAALNGESAVLVLLVAADVRHAIGQGAFDDELPNPNDGGGAMASRQDREQW